MINLEIKMGRKLLMVIIALLGVVIQSNAQEVAIKTNLLYGGYALTPNLGAEVKLGNRYTLDISGGYNWMNLKGSPENNKKAVHWLAQPELRYWLCESFNGHFFGAHLLGSQFNVSEKQLSLMFGKDSQNYRFEGWAVGAGISYGYHLMLAKRWGVEFSLGLGYAYMNFDKYRCPQCGTKLTTGQGKHYFGPTKAAVSLIFIIK